MTPTGAPGPEPFVVVDAEVDGRRVDVAVEAGRVVAVGPGLDRPGIVTVEARGAVLLPGLHDHHLHLLAMAAARRSIDLRAVTDAPSADAAIADAHRRHADRPDRWLRVVGYDDCHGPLDRARLDHLAPDRPVRVQHRSGAAWILSTPGLLAVGRPLDDGWVHRADPDLGAGWAGSTDRDDLLDDLVEVGAELAGHGITGVTDATPFADAGGFAILAEARATQRLAQRVAVTGGPSLAAATMPAGIERGPVKVIVADDALPSPDELVDAFRTARRAGRAVAVHCVTRVGLVLALTAWEVVGAHPGDRIEHASVLPLELVPVVVDLGLQVVTQPAFVRDRGDRYLAEIEPDDRPDLYRCGSLLAAGVGVGGSTDAPFGPADPWLAVATAVDRRTRSGAVLGGDESIAPVAALERFLSPLDHPGGPPRRVEPGAAADLCLLRSPLAAALADVTADPTLAPVRATWVAGGVDLADGG